MPEIQNQLSFFHMIIFFQSFPFDALILHPSVSKTLQWCGSVTSLAESRGGKKYSNDHFCACYWHSCYRNKKSHKQTPDRLLRWSLSLNTLLWETKRLCAVQNSEDSHFGFSFCLFVWCVFFFSFGKRKEQWLYVVLLHIIICAQNCVINCKGNQYHTLAEYTEL